MEKTGIHVVFLMFFVFDSCYLELFVLEAEQFATHRNIELERNGASGGKTVILRQNEILDFEICLEKPTFIVEKQLHLFDNGNTYVIEFSVDGSLEQVLRSLDVEKESPDSEAGSLDLSSSVKELPPGKHKLMFNLVQTDGLGVEIDSLTIDTERNEIISMECFDTCLEDLDLPVYDVNKDVPNARIVHHSQPTMCAEEDNVNIPIYHPTSTNYTVTALFPIYQTFINNREADFENCGFTMPIWEFKNVQLAHDNRYEMREKSTILEITDFSDQKLISISFQFVESNPDIGSSISLKIAMHANANSTDVVIGCNVYGRTKTWSSVLYKGVSRTGPSWFSVPDYTWSKKGENIVRFYTTKNVTFDIEYVKMQNRHIGQDQSFLIYQDSRVIIEGVKMGFWWLGENPLTVRRIDNGENFYGAHYIRVYRRVPWVAGGFSQVFVMYQDGNVRLLPLTPHGLDWIPFGSSVLIGETDPNITRPFALIEHIDIDPHKLTLYVRYVNGGYSTIEIGDGLRNTTIRVKDLVLKGARSTHPLLTFRSMWVSDGNSDVDSISVHGGKPHPILYGWKQLFGTVFTFFRKCISKHNSLAPDIHINFMTV